MLQGKPVVLLQPSDLQEYAAVTFTAWPISLAKPVKAEVDTIKIEAHRFEMLKMLYSTLDLKQTIIEEIMSKFPEFSKKSIDRYLKEISVREKRDEDEKVAYYATPEQWELLALE